MNDSEGSAVVVGDEGAQDGLVGVVVVPDRGGEREQALQDAREDALVGASTVAFEIELAFEGVIDRLDEPGVPQLEAGSGYVGRRVCWSAR